MSALSSVQPAVGSSDLFYNAPKAALNKIPDYINFEHGKDGIFAFLIEPQFTMTDTLRAVLGNDADKVGFGLVPYDPGETASAVVWLSSHPDAPAYAGPHLINAPEFVRENAIVPDKRFATSACSDEMLHAWRCNGVSFGPSDPNMGVIERQMMKTSSVDVKVSRQEARRMQVETKPVAFSTKAPPQKATI